MNDIVMSRYRLDENFGFILLNVHIHTLLQLPVQYICTYVGISVVFNCLHEPASMYNSMQSTLQIINHLIKVEDNINAGQLLYKL